MRTVTNAELATLGSGRLLGVLYLYLPGGFPAIVHEGDRDAYARHPLLGAFTDPLALVAAYDQACDAAIKRIVVTGRPNLLGLME